MSRAPHRFGLTMVLWGVAGVLGMASGVRAEVVLCRTWTGYVMARENSCGWGETEIALPKNTDTLADLNCSQDEIAKYDGTEWVCAPENTDTLMNLKCSTDQIAKYDGTEWVCAEEPDCPIGYTPLGGGACLDMRTQFAEQECASGAHFVDLGQTVFDCDTSLEWEKKTGEVGTGVDCSTAGACVSTPHDVNNLYTWSLGGPNWDFDGTAKTDFIDVLNTEPCYAGHCDWRLPQVHRDGGKAELETILLPSCPGGTAPCIDPIFGPTAADNYWSSVTSATYPNFAWFVGFFSGNVYFDSKGNGKHVRAVRTGP